MLGHWPNKMLGKFWSRANCWEYITNLEVWQAAQPAVEGRGKPVQLGPGFPIKKSLAGYIAAFCFGAPCSASQGFALPSAPHGAAGCGLPSSSASSGKGISGLAMAACWIRFIWALPELKLLETGFFFCIFRESPMYWPWPSLRQLDHILSISGVEREMAPLWREADWFCMHKDQAGVTQKSCAVAVQTLMSNEMSGDSSLETLCREIFL